MREITGPNGSERNPRIGLHWSCERQVHRSGHHGPVRRHELQRLRSCSHTWRNERVWHGRSLALLLFLSFLLRVILSSQVLQASWHAAQRSIFFWVAHLEWICSLCILGSPPPIRALDASGTGGPASIAHLQVYSWTVSRRLIGRSASCRFLTGPTTRTVTLPSPKATGGVSVFWS